MNNPLLSWSLGIVEIVYAGNDSLVWLVKIKTRNGKLSTLRILRWRKLGMEDKTMNLKNIQIKSKFEKQWSDNYIF